jgi:hypothetical protein
LRRVLNFASVVALLCASSGVPSAASAAYPAAQFELVGLTFDDGGQASGSFDFNSRLAGMPLPQFYNIQVATSAGAILPGSTFERSTICYDDFKRQVCTPSDDLVIYLETGTLGQPGYDRLQLAALFAPNAYGGRWGILDPLFSYEIGCTQSGCFTRHIVAGAIRWGERLSEGGPALTLPGSLAGRAALPAVSRPVIQTASFSLPGNWL